MHPLSYSEFVSTKQDTSNPFSLWDECWRYGGLPSCVLSPSVDSKIAYLRSPFHVTYLKDVIDRYRLREESCLSDIVKVLASSVGPPMSFNKIANTFESTQGSKISPSTVKLYVDYLDDAFLSSKAEPYTLKGRKFINAPGKYYFEDLGLRFAATDFLGTDQEPHCMENVIYNELITRGYIVTTGELNVNERKGGEQENRQYEVDFVCEKGGERIYIQSAFSVDNAEKMTQERRPLLLIKDSFRKIIVSKYYSGLMFDSDGILQMGLFDFLTKPELFGNN